LLHPLDENLAFRDWLPTRLLKSLTNTCKHSIHRPTLSTEDGSQTSIRGGYDAVLFVEVDSSLLFFENIWVVFNLKKTLRLCRKQNRHGEKIYLVHGRFYGRGLKNIVEVLHPEVRHPNAPVMQRSISPTVKMLHIYLVKPSFLTPSISFHTSFSLPS
jgi:hypothetical protein